METKAARLIRSGIASQLGRGGKITDNTLSIIPERYIPSAYIEAVKLVADVANTFLSLGPEKSQKKALKNISDSIQKISKELSAIRTLLSSINDKLDQIESKIDDQQTLNAFQSMKARQDVVLENYGAWQASAASGGELADAASMRLLLQEANRMLMRSGSYKYAFDLTISFGIELNLMLLLRVDSNTLALTINSMISFLRDAVDEDLPGSLANRLAISKQVVDVLEKWQSGLVREELISESWFLHDENESGYERCLGSHYKVILGDLMAGFNVVTQLKDVRDCYWTSWPHGIARESRVTSQGERRIDADRLLTVEELTQKHMLYVTHYPVVEFCTVAVPEIKRVIAGLEARLEQQSALEAD